MTVCFWVHLLGDSLFTHVLIFCSSIYVFAVAPGNDIVEHVDPLEVCLLCLVTVFLVSLYICMINVILFSVDSFSWIKCVGFSIQITS